MTTDNGEGSSSGAGGRRDEERECTRVKTTVLPILRPKFAAPTERLTTLPITVAPRRKRWTHKVKTGCRTCRTRRLKCDETRPECARCVRAGLACVYGLPSQQLPVPETNGTDLATYQPEVSTAPPQTSESYVERHLFRYYLSEVAEYMAESFNRPLWTTHLTSWAGNDPASWHACMAVAALHQRQRLWVGQAAQQGASSRREELYTTGVRQYHKSISNLIKVAPSASKKADFEVQASILGANLLFIVCSFQLGELTECIAHGRNAFKLIHLWRFWEQPSHDSLVKTSSGNVPIFSILRFYVLLDSLALEAVPADTSWPWQWGDALAYMSQRPLTCPEEACVELEMIWIGLKGMLNTIPFECSAAIRQSFEERRAALLPYYHNWRAKFGLLRQAYPNPTSSELADFKTVEARCIIVSVVFRVDIGGFETCWDEFEPEFESAVSLFESIHQSRSFTDPQTRLGGNHCERQSSPCVPSATKMIYFLAKVCRSPPLRHRIMNLFFKPRWGDRDLLIAEMQCSTTGFVRNAWAIIKAEEGAWDIPDAERPPSCNCAKGRFVCNGHRMFGFGVGYTDLKATTVTSLRTVNDLICKRETERLP